MEIIRAKQEPGVKLYTLHPGDVFSPADESSETHVLVMMVQPTTGRRDDRYVDTVNVVNLGNGHSSTASGSLRVIHHKRAAVVLNYKKD